MVQLRILSWNLRTFATHETPVDAQRRIAEIIVESQADIVCIQEVMIGNGVVGEVGAPISQEQQDIVNALGMAVHELDPDSEWQWACSGVDSGIADHMRDAYAFMVKSKPAQSKQSHPDAPTEIICLGDPVILRQPRVDNFPGRRPGMVTLLITGDKGEVTPINIVSYHAPTPCNKFSKGGGAGYGINALASLPEIGGDFWRGNGHKWIYIYKPGGQVPLPQIDTVVLGDFNYSMDARQAESTYQNLLTNYAPCISEPDKIIYTTYAPDSSQGLRLVSAYDNIFVLRPRTDFKPSLTFTAGGAIDFILQDSERLGRAIGTQPPDISTLMAWYVVHQDSYKGQHAVRGISDHLPVWAEFTVAPADGGALHIQPTSGFENNCLFHAVFGEPNAQGLFVDPDALDHRMELVENLAGFLQAGQIPAGRRDAILDSMFEDFADDPEASQMLALLMEDLEINPFEHDGFTEYYNRYMGNIKNGRMMYVNEALLLAYTRNITLRVHRYDRGQYYTDEFNTGHANTVDIFHQALHFSRWI